MVKNEIVNNLRLSKTYINNILIELNEKSNWNSTLNEKDLEVSEKLYKAVLEMSNRIF